MPSEERDQLVVFNKSWTLSLISVSSFLAAGLSGLHSVQAVLVAPDTATASSYFASDPSDFRFAPSNTIDGSGLPGGYGPTDAHADYAFDSGSRTGNHWTTSGQGNPTDEFITWSFNIPQTLDAIHIWNHRSTMPPAGNSEYDVTLFDLTVFDSTSNVLLTFNDMRLTPDTASGQTFSFGSALAAVSSIRFDIEATQGTPNFTGLAEVAFNTAAIPEPSSFLCLGLVALSFAGMKLKAMLSVLSE